MDISEHASPVVPGRKVPGTSEHIKDRGTASRKTLYDSALVLTALTALGRLDQEHAAVYFQIIYNAHARLSGGDAESLSCARDSW